MSWYDGILGGIGDFIAGGAEALVKARSEETAPVATPIPPPPDPQAELQAILFDPFALLETLGYREKMSAITYDTLKIMAVKIPVMPGILQTRLNQVARFNKAQSDDTKAGYEIVLRDKDEKASKQDRIRMRDLEQWVATCGSTRALTRESFGMFLRKFVGDSLVLDQACFEIKHGRGRYSDVPTDFYAVDGGSIRIADTAWNGRPEEEDDQIRYVQVHDESVIAELTPKQLCFGIRNPRTDLRINGYGWSEMEMCVHIITSLLNAYAYNSKYFSQGSVAKGMLNLPEVADPKLRIFARQWHMIASGVINAWRTPITNFKDAQWIDFHKSNKEMEFGEFFNLNIKLFAAAYCIDPAEIHFQYGNTGQSQQMFQSPEATKLKASKDKGLIPLMEWVAECLNKWLIWRIDDRFELRFTGLDPKDSEKSVDIEKKKVSYLMTVDEIRKENDLPAMKDGKGDVILDPTWLQFSNTIEGMKQQEAMGGMGGEGEEGMPGEGGPGAPGGEEEGEAGPEEPEIGEVGEDDWERLLNEATAKAMENVRLSGRPPGEALQKAATAAASKTARVRETYRGETVEYEIEL